LILPSNINQSITFMRRGEDILFDFADSESRAWAFPVDLAILTRRGEEILFGLQVPMLGKGHVNSASAKRCGEQGLLNACRVRTSSSVP